MASVQNRLFAAPVNEKGGNEHRQNTKHATKRGASSRAVASSLHGKAAAISKTGVDVSIVTVASSTKDADSQRQPARVMMLIV